MAMENDHSEQVRGLLRAIHSPGSKRDIVAAGYVRDIQIEGKQVTVHFAPNTTNQAKVRKMEADIHDLLSGSGRFERVELQMHKPFDHTGNLSDGGEPPDRPELIDDSAVPVADVLGQTKQRVDMAPEAGYTEDGPKPLDGPDSEEYLGALPVLQWEIDPQNPEAESGTADLQLADWEFRIWWQKHPSQLVYASIQAMREDTAGHDGAARVHPVGRSAAVNVVYDIERKAVVAIYGTVRDFRPFVDAFNQGYVLKNQN